MRETAVKVLGLVTQPNELGQYPAGALSRAENVVVRSPGKLSVLPALESRSTAVPFVDVAYNIFETALDESFGDVATQLLFFSTGSQDDLYWTSGTSGIAAPFEDTVAATPYEFTLASPRPIKFRDRIIINTDRGVMAADYPSPLSTAERTLRWAGLPQPHVSVLPRIDIGGVEYNTFLDNNDVCAYSAILKRTYADGYELIGDPAPIIRVKNCEGSPAFVQLTVRFGPDSATRTARAGVRAGDVIEIYRTPKVPSAGKNLDTDAGVDLYHVKTYTIVAADLTTNTATITDDAADASFGESLYTNPGIQSLQGARRQPPMAKAIGKYRGFTFYGNLTEPPIWSARFPGGLGTLNNSAGGDPVRKSGIGIREGIVGNATSGSPTITGIGASDMLGLDVFQEVEFTGGGGFTGTKTIVALTATTISVTANSTVTGPVQFKTYDILEVNGQTARVADLASLISLLGRLGSPYPWFNITVGATIAYKDDATFVAGSDYYQLTFSQSISLQPYRYCDQSTITIRGTNGQNYDPPIPLLSQTVQTFSRTPRENRVAWSWDQQPEAVSPGALLPVGHGQVVGFETTRDALWIFCTDGLYRLTGFGGGRSSGLLAQWDVDIIDPTFVIRTWRASCTLSDRVYAYGNLGLVEINDAGARPLSEGMVADELSAGGWQPDSFAHMAASLGTREVWLATDSDGTWIYNAMQQAFTKFVPSPPAFTSYGAMCPYGESLMFALTNTALRVDRFGTTPLAAVVDYQPIYFNDPLLIKQFIDMTVLFDTASTGIVVTSRFNGSASVGAALLTRQNDARRNFGVPRNAPAIGATLAPGFSLPAGGTHLAELRGLSVRFQPFGEQQVFR